MFRKFYPDANEILVSQFRDAAEGLEKDLSPAAIQGHFMFFKSDPAAAIEHVDRLSAPTISSKILAWGGIKTLYLHYWEWNLMKECELYIDDMYGRVGTE